MFSTILASMIAFSGLFFGHLLQYIAPEEIKPGKRYFISLQYILIAVLCITLLYEVSLHLNAGTIIAFFIGMASVLMMKLRYLYLGAAVFASSVILSKFFVLVASLVFLYGLPVGTLQKLKTKTLIIAFLSFFTPALLVALPQQFQYITLSFVIGSLAGRR